MTEDVTLVEKAPLPHLVVKEAGQDPRKFTLKDEFSIGRAEDNDLTLVDPKVSRHHARVVRQGVRFILRDLGSANGTWVDGVRLTAPHTLQHGQRIGIGDAALTYLESEEAFAETITAPVAAPPPRGEVRPPVESPPLAEPVPSKEKGGRRAWIVVAVLAALALLAVGALILVYSLAPGSLERIGLISLDTATPQAESTGPATPAATETPIRAPSPTPSLPAASPTPPLLAPTATPGTEDDLDGLLAEAENLTRLGKFREAINLYQEMARQAPDDARPEVGWAWALILDDLGDQALAHAQRAAELDPNSAGAAAVLGRAFIKVGDAEEALEAAERAVELDASNARARAVLAEAYFLNGQLQKAVDEADLALVQDANSAEAHRIRGWLYDYVDGDMGRAAGELQVAAGLQPDLWLRRHELGILLLEAGDYSTAILAFQDALALRPKAVTYAAIGQAYYQLGQYDQAQAALQQALSAGAEDVETYALAAAASAQRGRCEEAQVYYEQALALDATESLAREAKERCEGEGPPSGPSPTVVSSAPGTPTVTPEATAAATKPPAPPAAVSGRIAFPVWNIDTGQYDTYVANADGSGRQLVVDGMHQPAFSPDGEWLAAKGEKADHRNLFVLRSDGRDLKKITDFMEDKLPSWSPDSEGLVLATTRDLPGRPKHLYVIDEVPFVGRTQKGRLLVSGDKPVQAEYPTWTPDGRIVYKGCDYTVTPQQCGLFIIAAAGGPFKQLTNNGEDTAPAAFANRIAFMSPRDGNWEVYLMNDDGTGVKRLTNNAAHDGLPTWSPDGKTLAFVSNQGGAWAVWAMDPDGNNRRELFDIGGRGLASDWQNERISWAP